LTFRDLFLGRFDAMTAFGTPLDLSDGDFVSFAATLRKVLLEASVTNVPTNVSKGDDDPQPLFNKAFVYYYQAYFSGNYVDRFGTPLAKPTSLLTISDNEISGTVEVFLDLLMDFYLQTPIWRQGTSGSYSYLPGSGSNKSKTVPTVYAASQPGGVCYQRREVDGKAAI
jgi:hypothetical protein